MWDYLNVLNLEGLLKAKFWMGCSFSCFYLLLSKCWYCTVCFYMLKELAYFQASIGCMQALHTVMMCVLLLYIYCVYTCIFKYIRTYILGWVFSILYISYNHLIGTLTDNRDKHEIRWLTSLEEIEYFAHNTFRAFFQPPWKLVIAYV